MQVERRVNIFTMPRRRRFKSRIDCVAILGKLSSRLFTTCRHPSKPPFKCALLLFVAAVRQNKHVCSALTLIVTLRRGACCKSAIYLTCGERNVCLHSSLRHAINSVQIEKLRDRRSSFGGWLFVALEPTSLSQEM